MAVSDPVVMPLARELLACFETELAKVASPPLDIQLMPGIAPYADISQNRNQCCEGLGWVRVDTFFPASSTFPLQDEVPPAKGVSSAWAVVLEFGVFRCAPTPGADGIISGAQTERMVVEMMDDAAAMRRAICCLEASPGRKRQSVLAGPWTPLDVQGGCSGGYMTVTVRGPACDCSDAGDVS